MPASVADSTAPYWSLDLGDLGTSLGSGPDGLTAASAAERLAVAGPNSVEDAQRLGVLRLLWRQVESPLVLILIFAAAVSLGLSEWVDAAIILAIVIGSTLLGFYQEYRASAAVEELKRRLALTCRVVRDGVEQTVRADALVPGDVLVLSAGNLIPADGRVLDARDFLVSEASMTGESFPVEKQPGVVPPDAPLAERTNVVFLGASVRSGTARVLVVKTGRRTAFGAIAARLRAREPETDFARGLRRFGYLLIRFMVVIVLSVLTVNLVLHRPLVESLLFSVALAVGLSPELLPAIVSVTLSAGARAMSRQGVIVRRLDAIENLGSMTVLCTDKTGTLTEGTIVLAEATDPGGRASAAVRQLAFLNACFETGIDNPIDAAIVAAGERSGLSVADHQKIDEIPYDFLRKRLTIVMAARGDAGRHLVVTKGAFSNVLSICTQVEQDGTVVALTDVVSAGLSEYYEAKGRAGFRVLALATRTVAARRAYQRGDEGEMVFAGFLLFHDPPRADAARVLGDLAALNVAVKVITGDNRYVTGHLAETIGLDPTSMLTGEALAKLGDEALWHAAPTTSLFAEIDPQQKERIVRALQRTGHSVGYLGDGINDAPALHAADVGISVDQAVDVARESADIILLKRDLDVLRTGVEDGRRAFANTLKYISITTSANFGNMISMAIAAPLLPFLPLVAKQILLNNILSDVPSMAISTDHVDAERVTHPQRWDIGQIRHYMIVFGLVSSIFDLLTFAALLLFFRAGEAAFRTTWFVVSLLTELGVVLILRTRGPAWRSRPSGLLLWATVAATVFALAVPFLGSGSALFGFVPLSFMEMATVAGIVTAYLVATEATKRWFFRPRDPSRMTHMRLLLGVCLLVWASPAASAQGRQTAVNVSVRTVNGAVPGAEVVVNGVAHQTDEQGRVSIDVAPGDVEITALAEGLSPVTTTVTIEPGQQQTVIVELQAQPTVEEELTVVAATRTNRRLEDVPMRVEVLPREEIEEKMLMTPGDIVMMLNEMGGMRVQATSPALGAATVRVQGMRGRYTRFLSDGLPLFGDVGGIGLLQIPPMDLGQVEVIKGVASALYGADAMAGVVNLISRRPGAEPLWEVLVNRSTRGATDTVLFGAVPLAEPWRLSILTGGHWQERTDVDGDAWADLPGYARGLVRPRLFWDGGNGRTFLATIGATYEDRTGGTMQEAVPAVIGRAYREALNTVRIDGGAVGQTLLGDRYVLSARVAASRQRHDHRFGEVRERDRHETIFGEVTLRGSVGRHTWVVGTAVERDAYSPRDRPEFGYVFVVPGLFVQDDVDLADWLAASVSGRLDHHSEYGAFLSPRISVLLRNGGWTARLSAGAGFFGPAFLTEETEATGLSRLTVPRPLRAERGRSASLDLTRTHGPASVTVTLFASRVLDPIRVGRSDGLVLTNQPDPMTNNGVELLGTVRRPPLALTGSYTFVNAREWDDGQRVALALTPRHSAGVVGMIESEDTGRLGIEVYYTGRQRLELNPFRTDSEPYVLLGMLAERRVGPARLFVNFENITNVRQSDWDPLLLPERAPDGRWTVDAWAPLDGRTINAGVRLGF